MPALFAQTAPVIYLHYISAFQVPGNSGENPERSCHCNPTIPPSAGGLSIQVTVPERGWEGQQYRESQETYLKMPSIAR
jgi:hypothetical protein